MINFPGQNIFDSLEMGYSSFKENKALTFCHGQCNKKQRPWIAELEYDSINYKINLKFLYGNPKIFPQNQDYLFFIFYLHEGSIYRYGQFPTNDFNKNLEEGYIGLCKWGFKEFTKEEINKLVYGGRK